MLDPRLRAKRLVKRVHRSSQDLHRTLVNLAWAGGQWTNQASLVPHFTESWEGMGILEPMFARFVWKLQMILVYRSKLALWSVRRDDIVFSKQNRIFHKYLVIDSLLFCSDRWCGQRFEGTEDNLGYLWNRSRRSRVRKVFSQIRC